MLSYSLVKSFVYPWDKRNGWIQEIKIEVAKGQQETIKNTASELEVVTLVKTNILPVQKTASDSPI